MKALEPFSRASSFLLRGGFSTSLRNRLLARLRDRLQGEPLPLRIAFWDGEIFDLAPDPLITITLQSKRLLRFFLTGNMGRLAQAYVEGELGVDGRIGDVLQIGIALAERIGNLPLLRRAAPLLAYLPRRHNKAADAKAVRYHYDVSNDFYRPWLDAEMIYSCAYFINGAEDLDTAQQQKLDHICRKLRLAPGERCAIAGCGWGGLLLWAAARYGVTGLGITLSQRQCDEAHARLAARGLEGRIEFCIADYRDLDGAGEFNKILSVGMYEDVGAANLPLYFATVARLLRPGRLALNPASPAPTATAASRGRPVASLSTGLCFRAGRSRISRGCSTRLPGPGSKSSTWRICGRTTR